MGYPLGYATWQREFSLEVLGNSEQTIETISRTEKNKKMKVGIMNTVCFGKLNPFMFTGSGSA